MSYIQNIIFPSVGVVTVRKAHQHCLASQLTNIKIVLLSLRVQLKKMGCFESKEGSKREPTAVRGCTDVCWLCIFIVFCIIMVCMLFY